MGWRKKLKATSQLVQKERGEKEELRAKLEAAAKWAAEKAEAEGQQVDAEARLFSLQCDIEAQAEELRRAKFELKEARGELEAAKVAVRRHEQEAAAARARAAGAEARATELQSEL